MILTQGGLVGLALSNPLDGLDAELLEFIDSRRRGFDGGQGGGVSCTKICIFKGCGSGSGCAGKIWRGAVGVARMLEDAEIDGFLARFKTPRYCTSASYIDPADEVGLKLSAAWSWTMGGIMMRIIVFRARGLPCYGSGAAPFY